MRDLHEDDIVRLAQAMSPAQAHIWQNALENEGIRCKVVGDYLDAGIGDIPGIRAEVWVHEDDYERATVVLEEHQEASEDDEDDDEEE